LKKLTLIVFLLSAISSSCAIKTNRGEAPLDFDPEVAVTPESPAKKAAIRKTITDQDLKKTSENTELKKRVAVLPFLDRKGTLSADVLKNSRDAFVDSLNKTGELIAVDPSVLKLDLKKYIKNNTYDLKAIARDSQSAGVSSVLEGRIVDMRFQNEEASKVDNSSSLKMRPVVFEIVVQARILNIRSEQELFNMVKTVVLDDESSQIPENVTSENFFNNNPELAQLLIRDAFLDYSAKLIDSLKLITWEGRIAMLQGEKIYLNVGQISGVQVGDILKVVDDGNEIYDPELGYHLGKVPGKVKGTVEVIGFFGQDGAVGVIHSGAGFKENDRIEIYQ
jgi:hypothetical protein